MTTEPAPDSVVDRYLALFADPDASADQLLGVLHPEVQVVEHPNRFSPNGSVRDLAMLRESFGTGRTVLESQRFESIEHVVAGQTVATRAVWVGVLARDTGPLPAGAVLRAHIAHFFAFRDGLIWRQETFDCFDPTAPGDDAARSSCQAGDARPGADRRLLRRPVEPYDESPWCARSYLARPATEEQLMTTPTPLVTGVDFVSVPTRNFEAAMHFYGTVLGLPCSVTYGRVPGAEFETGNLTLQIFDFEAVGHVSQPTKSPIALHVEDVEAARAELESRGVSFYGDTVDSGVCHMALFEDPDGNQLMLHHRYAPRSPAEA